MFPSSRAFGAAADAGGVESGSPTPGHRDVSGSQLHDLKIVTDKGVTGVGDETIIGEHPETQKPGSEAHASDPGEVVADALRAPGRIRTCATASGGRCSIP